MYSSIKDATNDIITIKKNEMLEITCDGILVEILFKTRLIEEIIKNDTAIVAIVSPI